MFEIEDDLRRAREEKRRKKRKEKEAAAAAAGGNAAAGGDGSSGSEVQLRTHRRKHSSGSSQNRLSKSVVDVIGQKVLASVAGQAPFPPLWLLTRTCGLSLARSLSVRVRVRV